MNATLFFIVVILFVAAMAAAAGIAWRKARRRTEASWEALLARLEPINREAVAAIAHDLDGTRGGESNASADNELDPAQAWDMIGGLSGLEAMQRNCAVLIDLAAYVQRWHPEAVVVAEQLRLNSREIQFHLDRLRGAVRTGNLHNTFADYGERAVARYYQMTQTVLALYETSKAPGWTALEQAISVA